MLCWSAWNRISSCGARGGSSRSCLLTRDCGSSYWGLDWGLDSPCGTVGRSPSSYWLTWERGSFSGGLGVWGLIFREDRNRV